MATVGLFYGTETGNTRKVAKQMQKYLGEDKLDIHNVAKATVEDFLKYSALIVGMPTLGDGELENSMRDFLAQLGDTDLSGKTIALYGLGDQSTYGHEFLDGMAPIYKKFKKLGAKLIGQWSTEGYDFSASKALEGDEFICLAIDNDNQADLTGERVKTWLEQVRSDLGV